MDLKRLAPSVRGLRVYSLYGGIAACAFITASDYPSVAVKFYSGLTGAVLLAIKATGTSSPKDQPHDPPKG